PEREAAAWGQDATVPPLSELAPAVALAGADPAHPFLLGHGSFSVSVDGELLTRLDGMVAFSGQLSFQPEMKRFRGRATDKAFGEGPARMVRAKGRGVLYVEPSERRTFLAVDLGEDSAYFRDECVFAFEEPVMFENGRVPSDIAPDLDLVHLRGQGRVLLSLPGPLRSVPVGMEQPVTVPLTHLVGWQGNLTPRVVPLLKSPTGEVLRTAVELGGEGFALIALGVR
ncbi:AIM24 family protein, partial [Pyxidicoccus sp. 3LG]